MFAKLGHYNTVIMPKCLYVAENLELNRKVDKEQIQVRTELQSKRVQREK